MCIEEFLGVEYVVFDYYSQSIHYIVMIIRLTPSRVRRKSGAPMTIVPSLLGEMLLHSNQVKVRKLARMV